MIFMCAAFETEQMCFAMYCTYCESGSGSVFIAAFSCLEMGPSEQRQYFTGAWQAAAKVFTAWLQCGKMDPARDAHAARGPCTTRALTRCCLILYRVRSQHAYILFFWMMGKMIVMFKHCLTPEHFNAVVVLRWWFCCSLHAHSTALWVRDRYCLVSPSFVS